MTKIIDQEREEREEENLGTLAKFSDLSIHIEKNGLAWIVLNKPELHNAFDDVMIEHLCTSLQALEQNNAVRILVLSGIGKNFSAGADLNWMRRVANYSKQKNYQDACRLKELMQRLYQFSKPTIAAVNGPAFGGGVGLVACCDIAIASETALFCFSEVKLGVIPAVISPYVLAAIGQRQALRYMLSAEKINAVMAKSLGLVHEVVPSLVLKAKVNVMASKLLQNSPNAMSQVKQLIRHIANQGIGEEITDYTAQKIAEIRASKEGQEGISAFLDRRKPIWIME